MKGPAVALLAGLAVGAAAGAEDLRSRVVLDQECESALGTRRTTLFANGTIRVRTRLEAEPEEEMQLGELDRGELEAYVSRLGAIDLSESESTPLSARGDWIERCELTLELGERPPLSFAFSRFDSLPLGLSRVVAIAEELGAEAVARDAGSGFPPGYRAQPGDVLIRADGARFEVVGPTADGRGIELRGFDQPLTIFVLEEALATLFVGLVEEPQEPVE